MPESQQTSAETLTTSAETRTPATELEQITELLGGEPENLADNQDEGSGSEAGAETRDEKAAPKNLADLAERLGVKVADLYELEIPFDVGGDDGGEVEYKKLGEIKDAFKASDAIAVDRLTWEETKAAQEQKIARATSELQQLVALLPKSAISDELLQTVARRRADAVAKETRLTRNVIPEWSSEDVETADRAEMSEYLQRYGFPTDYLDAIVDHKTVHFIRDATKRALRVEKALEQIETLRKSGHKPSGKVSKLPGKKTAPRRVRASDQVDQVVEILSQTG